MEYGACDVMEVDPNRDRPIDMTQRATWEKEEDEQAQDKEGGGPLDHPSISARGHKEKGEEDPSVKVQQEIVSQLHLIPLAGNSKRKEEEAAVAATSNS
ncbi:hypothetical protein NDU88_002576 [Pleurodeles waltl]|uniref:Uncharacterized protein n=1 Tax=Pleurodeles waltl TaxID=8319 RepID=A0AAV7L1M9_PLEWA|nr:hypothetical protein NDU88_002576 [Pleurodeles waltl]